MMKEITGRHIPGCRLTVMQYRLNFRQPAGTSRGVYTYRDIWYILLTTDQPSDRRWGIGECSPLPGLSPDDLPDYEEVLRDLCRQTEERGYPDWELLRRYPSILFGMETAFLQFFRGGDTALWDTSFSREESGIPINGLVWMGDYRQMLEQVEAKIAAGFRCIKLKIGALRFEEELALLRHIRRHFSSKEIELRVDANGAFSPAEALDKLHRLAGLDIHSIEQPIRAGQWDEMARLVRDTPLPIALDEELIGQYRQTGKRTLLETIRPQYIILKPSLHGGLSGCEEWIEEAERLQTGWWITSALESNVGLNAIAQWCATLNPVIPQGLGTGSLYTNNIELPLSVRNARLHYTRFWDSENDPASFLNNWLRRGDLYTNYTSGSTGAQKRLPVEKERMRQSARLTCSFLSLRKGDAALLCLPVQYIGGKMMIVRSLEAGLHLTIRTASGHPMAEVDRPFRFAAMTPLQVYNSLQVPEEKERLCRIEILLIGGGAIGPDLEKEIRKLPNEIYSTYGMTETLSHIALRRLNGKNPSPYYTPFPSVSLSLSADQTLVIDAPEVSREKVVTNDLAELLPDGRFRMIGRKDNTINSGGIKIQTEALEEKLRPYIPFPFAITSIPDAGLGEAIALLSEEEITDDLRQRINETLHKYERPRHIGQIPAIPLTASGKIDRHTCRETAIRLLLH